MCKRNIALRPKPLGLQAASRIPWRGLQCEGPLYATAIALRPEVSAKIADCHRLAAVWSSFGRRLPVPLRISVFLNATHEVHIRRSDKGCEAKANFELSDDRLLQRILQQPPSQPSLPRALCLSLPLSVSCRCQAWGMNGVFLCTDDASLKQRLTNALERTGQDPGRFLLSQIVAVCSRTRVQKFRVCFFRLVRLDVRLNFAHRWHQGHRTLIARLRQDFSMRQHQTPLHF